MKKPKISVIVPVYNVEMYVEKCLESLIGQTYQNLEIIIVDDCSTDNSVQVVQNLIKDNKNIIFYKNDKNRGLSYTRNFAFSHSTGEYISFIDSDDYIPLNYYEEMINTCTTNNSSIIVCDIVIIDTQSNISNRTYCGGDNKLDFVCNTLAASACNKIFKKDILNKYKFSEGKINEDLAVVLPAIVHAEKIGYTNKTYYNYIQRNNSIQNSSFSDKRFDIFYGVSLTLDRIHDVEDYEKYKEGIVYYQIIVMLIYVIPKENNLFKRAKWLKKFNVLSYDYNIRQNKYFWQFLSIQSTKTRYYYKILFYLNYHKFYHLNSLFIGIANLYLNNRKSVIKNNITIDDLILSAKKQSLMKDELISISAVIPNYNYERFMYQRLYSILTQNYKIKEIIILDDFSSDNSRKVIDDVVSKIEKYIPIKKVYNNVNSKSPFKQWRKGFNLAESDYVWIAEADDYCSKNLLREITKPVVNNSNIRISYADTAFINSEGKIILKSIIPEIDIMKTGHWRKNFVNNGENEYNNYAFLNCTIANVSSCIIKKDNYDKEFELSGQYKQAGDWLFYVNVMHKGDIAFTNKVLNYYRVHGNNVSSVFKKEEHLKEIKNIHSFYRKKYTINRFQEEQIKKRYDFLVNAWNLKDNNNDK